MTAATVTAWMLAFLAALHAGSLRRRARHDSTNGASIGPIRLTRAQIVATIERGARERLRISAEEMVRRFHDDALEDPGEVADLLAYAGLLAEGDPLFVRP